MKTVGYIATFIVIGFLATLASYQLKSDFLSNFLSEQLVTVIITLLAINTATSSLVLARLDDLGKKYEGADFTETIKEIKKSLLEQIALIFIAIVVAMFQSSKTVDFCYSNFLYDTLNTTLFIYTIYILRDVGMLMFDIYNETHEKK